MKIRTAADYQDLSQMAAQVIIDRLSHDPDSTLVLATGNTPLGTYANLAAAYRDGAVSFSTCLLVELDDYFHIPLDDPRNLYNWLERDFISQVDLDEFNILRFNSAAPDPDRECRRVENQLAAWGGIDLAVLGLGPNGHLGFNEPGSNPTSKTRLVKLSPASIASSARYWGSEDAVPRQGVTLGLGTLMAAREILLLVSGNEKSGILKAALQGPITTALPASLLQTHPKLTVIADQDALGD